ncbi:CcdB family protein [Variovorax sp. dw_308]|uniref:CcdB family protein n=1 Tax=Variovorax sp. dw_308 TaxID=2721546 RepID=UPI001C48C605|nr:CcdB family protein [Variovorax sp. dw_308]
MAQFDVYVNPQPASRQSTPYVVDVQSQFIGQLNTRFVMPLSRVGVASRNVPVNLCPVVQIEGEALSLMAHLAAPATVRMLGKPVASLTHRASEITGALNAVISGF